MIRRYKKEYKKALEIFSEVITTANEDGYYPIQRIFIIEDHLCNIKAIPFLGSCSKIKN